MTKAMEPKLSMTLARLAVGVAIMLLAATSSHAQDQRNFWALNNSGETIIELYASPHNQSSWGEDQLGADEFPSGLGGVIRFEGAGKSSCLMDFHVVFSDGSTQTYTDGMNTCQYKAVLFYKRKVVGMITPN